MCFTAGCSRSQPEAVQIFGLQSVRTKLFPWLFFFRVPHTFLCFPFCSRDTENHRIVLVPTLDGTKAVEGWSWKKYSNQKYWVGIFPRFSKDVRFGEWSDLRLVSDTGFERRGEGGGEGK